MEIHRKQRGWLLGMLALMLFLFLSTPALARDTLGRGETLLRGQELVSHNGRFRLSFQTDGNLVLYGGSQALWSSRTPNKGGQRLVMQRDGNLVMYGPNGPVWATNTSGNPIETRTMTGNLPICTE
jgi:hypothetical protein